MWLVGSNSEQLSHYGITYTWTKKSIVYLLNVNCWHSNIDIRLLKMIYCKVPKFSDTRKLWCNLPKTQTKRQNLLMFRLKDAKGIAISEDPDQTAPLGAV